MSKYLKEEKKLLEKVVDSRDPKELDKLSFCKFSTVRRAVALNPYTFVKTIERLQVDPVLNVSYVANKSAKVVKKRDLSFFTNHRCVQCILEPLEMIKACTKCQFK